MKPVTMQELEELEALRAKATQGGWYSHHCKAGKDKDCWCKVIGTTSDPDHELMDSVASMGSLLANDADYIAHLHPDFVARLIHTQRKRVEGLKFYGNKESWADQDPYVQTPCIFKPDDATGWEPQGNKARETLKELGVE